METPKYSAIIKLKNSYIKQSLTLIGIILVDFVLPLQKRILFNYLQIIHLIEQMRQEVLGKSLRVSVYLHCIDRLNLLHYPRLLDTTGQILLQNGLVLLDKLLLLGNVVLIHL